MPQTRNKPSGVTQAPATHEAAPKASWEVPIQKVTAGGTIFRLRTPLRVNIAREEDHWSCEAKDLSILSFGASRESALESFSEDFLAIWEIIGKSPDERLSRGALRVKQCLRDLVESVVQG